MKVHGSQSKIEPFFGREHTLLMPLTLLRDYPFLIPLIVSALAEVTKHLHEGLHRGVWFQHGGMPSSHSAFVTSLLMVVGVKEGMGSAEFAIATVFACVVWYDAAFVRSQVGKQAKVLNILQQFQAFSERIGHSVMEVIAGIIFGAAVTLVGIALS